MQKKEFGASGVMVTPLILGCWEMGGDYFGRQPDDSASVLNIQKAIDLGITSLDTAVGYGAGQSERVIGKAVKGRRDQVELITKVPPRLLGRADAVKACEDALERLGTDYLDCLFMHYPSNFDGDPYIPIEESMDAFLTLKKQGKIRSIGLSNFSLEEQKAAEKCGPIDVIQPCYSLLWRFIDLDGVREHCVKNNVSNIPYSPLAQGILTGKMPRKRALGPTDRRAGVPLFQEENYEPAFTVVDKLVELSGKYGRTPAQLALNWLCATEGVTAPIIGTNTEDHLRENIEALDFSLEKADYDALDKVSREYAYKLPKYKSFFVNEVAR